MDSDGWLLWRWKHPFVTRAQVDLSKNRVPHFICWIIIFPYFPYLLQWVTDQKWIKLGNFSWNSRYSSHFELQLMALGIQLDLDHRKLAPGHCFPTPKISQENKGAIWMKRPGHSTVRWPALQMGTADFCNQPWARWNWHPALAANVLVKLGSQVSHHFWISQKKNRSEFPWNSLAALWLGLLSC